MRKLLNQTKNLEVARDVREATSFWARSKGLLGASSLDEGATLWIKGTRFVGCNSIHTWFMRFNIDVVFVDRDLKVRAVYQDLGPWRMTFPVRGAVSAFEFASGTLSKSPVAIGDTLEVIGDQLHVLGS